MPVGVVGETNESLAEAYLAAREGHAVCRGVVESLKESE